MKTIKLLFITISSLLPVYQYAQVNVDYNNTNFPVEDLVDTLVSGGCISISNVTFTGHNRQIGYFTDATSSVGFASGIAMNTGHVDDISGDPVTGNDAVWDWGLSGGPTIAGDTDLDVLVSPELTEDAAILEFDFVPQNDTVEFEYVFLSEEYPTFVCGAYNDIFAFFISGPGITNDPGVSGKNIALIPGTTTPVSINNVNHGNSFAVGCTPTNASYHIVNNNLDGGTVVNTAVEYHGYTTVLTARAVVTPCQTYHMKLAIADVADGTMDSGVLLKANSFTTGSSVQVSTASPMVDSTEVYEGCGGAGFVFTLPQAEATPTTINYTIGGTAANGTDYTTIGTSVTIPAGQLSETVYINPIADGLTEGTEIVTLTIPGACSCDPSSSVSLDIVDYVPLNVTASSDVDICLGDNTNLTASYTGGSENITYSWNNGGGTGSPVNVSPTSTTTYTVTATDVCGNTDTDQVVVDVQDNDASWTTPGSICEAAGSINLNPTITGTTGGTWSGSGVSGNTFNPSGLSGNIAVTYSVGTVPCVETLTQNINVVPDVDPSWTTPGTICEAAGNINLNLIITGTTGGTWSGSGVSGNTFNPSGLSGNIAITYTVGTAPCVETSTQNINVVPDVDPSWTTPGDVCEAAGNINLNPTITGTTGGTWSGSGVSGNTFNPSGLSGNIAITYTVGTAPCIETSTQNINVVPDVDPSWTTPGDICEAAGNINLNSTITGTTGGTWSGSGVSGNTFNPSGLSGNIAITYTVGTAPCVETSTQNINIVPDVDPSWTTPGAICEASGNINLNSTITGTTGGTWSGSGVSGNTFNPSGLSGNIAITYTVGTAPCVETSTQNINVVPDVDPSWTTPGTICEAAGNINLNPTVTGTTGGTWSGSGVSGNTFNPSGLSGNIAITYSVGNGSCLETLTQNINVVPDVNPSWTTPGAICEASGNINLNSTITGTTGGTWSGSGVSGNTFNPSGLSGNIAITYTVGTAPCVETSTQNINVVPDVDPSWTTPGTICEAAGTINLNPTITGTTGGTWSGSGVSGNTFNPSGLSGNIAITYTVGTGSCQETLTQDITVTPDVNPAWTTPGTICESAGSINLNNSISGTIGGTWSGSGVLGNTFDPTGLSGPISVTYTVGTAPCEETSTQTITVTPDVDPSLNQSSFNYCEASGTLDLTTFISGTTGGTWSGTGVTGNNFDPSVGTQTLTYTVGTTPCLESSTITINVTPDVDPTLTTNNQSICEGDGLLNLAPFEAGTTGGTWSGTGVSGTSFDPLSGTQTLTYSVGTGACVETANLTVTVDPEDDPSFSFTSSTFCLTGVNPTATISGTNGGTFSISAPGVLADNSTGEINLLSSGVGTYWIYYNTASAGNPCPNIDSVQITITSAPSASFSYDASAYCQYDSDPVISFGAGASAGVFSTSPATLSVNPADGSIDLSSSTADTYWVYNFIAASGGCAQAIDSTQLIVHPLDDATFSYAAPFCVSGTNPTANITGTTGGTFSISAPGVLADANTGEIDLAGSGIGTFWIYYNTSSAGNPCPVIDSVQIDITTSPEATFNYYSTVYCEADSNSILPQFGSNAYPGVFSSNPSGISFIDPNTGEIDLINSTPGSYWVVNYLAGANGCADHTDSTQITINPIYLTPLTVDICQGDSTFLEGAYQNTNGVYYDTLVTVSGCDSIIETTLNLLPVYLTNVNEAICNGDSLFVGGAYQLTAGTYYDTLSTTVGCDSIIETVLTINPTPVPPVVFDTIVCLADGDPVLFASSSGGTIYWYDDAGLTNLLDSGNTYQPSINATGTNTYYLIEVLGSCIGNPNSMDITIQDPSAIISTDPIVTSGSVPFTIEFTDLGTGSTSQTWDFGNGDSDTGSLVEYTYTDEGMYEVILSVTDNICWAYDTVQVDAIVGESVIFTPNVFTPNDDGVNDVWFMNAENIETMDCQIMNRWGQVVYQITTAKGGWDGMSVTGSPVADGTYYFFIKATGLDGKEYDITGSILLTR